MQIWPTANGGRVGWIGICAVVTLFLATTSVQTEESTMDGATEKHDVHAVEGGVVLEEKIHPDSSEIDLFLEQIHFHDAEGARLYRLKMYKDAFPHLRYAAQAGFKMAQLRLAYVYAHGLGEVEQDPETALAWLGVASELPTHPVIHH